MSQRYLTCFPTVLAEFNVCYDNAATDCNGTEIPNVITARNCCLGDGFWFHDVDGGCHQCIGKHLLVSMHKLY